ncbi:zinc finger, CCHC-type containing protein [Tanacetum coccineum]
MEDLRDSLLFLHPFVSIPSKEPEQKRGRQPEKVQKPSSESTAQVPPPEEEESIFMEIPKPKAKKTVNVETQDLNSPKPTSYQPKLPYPERMKVRENDKPIQQMVKLVAKEQREAQKITITTVNAECSAIIMNKVPEKLEDPEKFLIPCALQELDRTSALADSGANINLLPHSIYKQLGLEALTPTRMTLELANHSITHPMGIAEDVVVRVDGFTFLADFVMVNFEPDPRVPIILGRPFLRTAKALIDLYEETLTLRVGKEELVYYADKSEKNKDKNFVHTPFLSSSVKTNDNLEEFADELNLLKKDIQEGNFQDHLNPLFEFNDNFKSSTINPLFDEMEKDVGDDIDEIDVFLAMEVSSNFEEGYFDSEGHVTFLDNLLSNDASHNLTSEVISNHEPEQHESLKINKERCHNKSNVTVSSCSNSNIQEKTQLSRSRCMHSLKEIKSLFKFLSETLQDYGTMPIFKRTFSQDLDLQEQHLNKDILSRTDCTTTLTDLRTKFENAFHSEFEERMQNYTRYDAQSFYDAMIFNMDSIGKYMLELILHQQRTPQLLKQKKLIQTQKDHSHPIPALKVDFVVIQNTCSEKEDSNSETASNKLVKECSLNSETKDVHAIKYKMSKAKERCMAYFRSLHSHLQVLSKDDLKGTRIEHGFKRAFMSLFGQDVDTFTSTMLLNVDQLQKQLDKDEFQEDAPAAFWSVYNHPEVHQYKKALGQTSTMQDDSSSPEHRWLHYDGKWRLWKQHYKDLYDSIKITRSKTTEQTTSLLANNAELKAQIRKCAPTSARIQTTTDDRKPNPRSNNQTSRSLPVSKSSRVTITAVPKADHSKSSSSFSDSKNFVCSTCHKCVFNANHDACITKLLKEVNSRAKIQSNKTTNSNKPVDQKSHTQKPGRQIFTGHRFSPNKTSAVYEKTSPRSDLSGKPTVDFSKLLVLGRMPTRIELTLEQSQQGVSNDVLMIVDIEDDIMDPVMQCTTLPSHSGFSQKKLVSFVTEIHTLSIDISLRDC